MNYPRGYLLAFLLIGFFLSQPTHAEIDFEQAKQRMQKSDCLACHAETGKIIGPSFKEIAIRYDSNPKAVSILTETVKKGSQGKWGTVPMPPHPTLSEKEIQKMVAGILTLVKIKAGGGAQVQTAAISRSDIIRGRRLFQGNISFKNGGPTCISCHHVKNDAVIGGGILAKDLTTVFSRLGASGVRTILGTPPFPVMEHAYMGKHLTKDEIHALVAFLQDADQKQMFQHPRDYGWGLFLSGLFGTALVFLFFSGVGARRKKFSVNEAIYRRQLKSQ